MRKKDSFKPVVSGLESRQLLSITLNQPRSSLIFNMLSSVNSKQTGPLTGTADTVVGAGYYLDVQQQSYAQIASVTFTMPHSLDGDGVTAYNTASGYYGYRGSVVETTNIYGPHNLPGLNQLLDATPGTVDIKVDVKYVSATFPDDKYDITLNVHAPAGELVANFPPTQVSSPTAYWIGPRDSNRNPAPWVYKQNEIFGVGGYGLYPFEFGGIGHNQNNPITGDFFLSQVATVTSVGSKGALFYGPLGGNYSPWNDNGGRSDLGLDEYPNSTGIPVATNGDSVRAKGNWSLPVIVKSEVDNPGQMAYMSSSEVPSRMYYHGTFRTMLCYQAWGNSIPIVISYVDWKINYDFYNKASESNPTTANAFGNPKLWAGTAEMTPGIPVNNSLSLFPRYNYNLPAYLKTIQDPYFAQGAIHGSAQVHRDPGIGRHVARVQRIDYGVHRTV